MSATQNSQYISPDAVYSQATKLASQREKLDILLRKLEENRVTAGNYVGGDEPNFEARIVPLNRELEAAISHLGNKYHDAAEQLKKAAGVWQLLDSGLGHSI